MYRWIQSKVLGILKYLRFIHYLGPEVLGPSSGNSQKGKVSVKNQNETPMSGCEFNSARFIFKDGK